MFAHVFIADEDVESNVDDDDARTADYGIIGVLDCSVINCPLFPPERLRTATHAQL